MKTYSVRCCNWKTIMGFYKKNQHICINCMVTILSHLFLNYKYKKIKNNMQFLQAHFRIVIFTIVYSCIHNYFI